MENNGSSPDSPVLDSRLMSAASFVRHGKIAADIGTDHAYIPIYLIINGVCERCIASDINASPVEKARNNIDKYKLSHKIEVIRTNGLDGIERTGAEDIIICGMGGELICEIINEAEFVFDKKINLILQPMSKADKLRTYLSNNGFFIQDEKIIKSGGKIYQCLKAYWSGVNYTLTLAELLIGPQNIKRGEAGDGIFTELIDKSIKAVKKRLDGRISGNLDIEKETELLNELNKIRIRRCI